MTEFYTDIGNADPIHGKEAVRAAVLGFWASIDGLTHHLLKVVESGDTMVASMHHDELMLDCCYAYHSRHS